MAAKKVRKLSAAEQAAQEAADEQKMKDILMTRRTRKMYERMQRAKAGKAERIDVLHQRKRALEEQEQQKGAGSGKAAAEGKKQSGSAKRTK